MRWILGFLAFAVMVGLSLVMWQALSRRGFDPIGELAKAISPAPAVAAEGA